MFDTQLIKKYYQKIMILEINFNLFFYENINFNLKNNDNNHVAFVFAYFCCMI